MHRIKISTEFDKVIDKLENKENFAISRFGDGEMTIIRNQPIDLSKSKGEFNFDPSNEMHQSFRGMLRDSLADNMENYLKGVPCFCCAPEFLVNETLGGISDKKSVTLANIFVNNNIFRFNEFISAINGRNIIVVCDWKAASVQNPQVPLNIRYCFRTKGNCIENTHILGEIATFIHENNVEDFVFLFFSGPLSNVLTHQLYKFNNKNTYIDLGSVFDPIFYGRKTRGYHDTKHPNCNKICVMELPEYEDGNL